MGNSLAQGPAHILGSENVGRCYIRLVMELHVVQAQKRSQEDLCRSRWAGEGISDEEEQDLTSTDRGSQTGLASPNSGEIPSELPCF